MKWPWSKSQPEQPAAESQPEQRAAENPNYTALWLMQAAQMAKAGSVVALEGLGIVQASYRIVERAFQSIVVQTKAPITIPPALLGCNRARPYCPWRVGWITGCPLRSDTNSPSTDR